jgi:hypothetical protein
MTLRKIISGGQTGADQGGLEAADALDLETGGTMPKGFQTEDGPNPKLAQQYGLTEGPNGYRARTKKNVLDADATLLFGRMSSAGSKLTLHLCRQFDIPFFVNPPHDQIVSWLKAFDEVDILNVAGNRESRNPGIQARVRHTIIAALQQSTFA